MKSIPVPLTSFIGRSHELRDVIAALEHDRLVTLTGIGGVGKTRLAQAVAQAHSGDVIWVDLAPLDNEALIGPTVVRALGLAEAPRSDAATLVAEAIADTEFLLVVDNCEHLLDPVASLIETWLRSCPFLRILATSRESVRVPGEFVYLVPPLALEAAGDEVPDAIRLFIERARSASGLFELDNGTGEEVASLCRHLDGIPLAIELAAARVRALGVSEVLAGLHDSLGLLTAGPRTALA